MNKVYTILFNAFLNRCVFTSELSCKQKKCCVHEMLLKIISALLLISAFSSAFAGTCVQIDAVGSGSVAGTGANTPVTCGAWSIAIGAGSGAVANNYGIAIGDGATSTGNNSVAVGRVSIASADSSTAIGMTANASGNGSSAFGHTSKAAGLNSIAMGIGSNAGQTSAVAIGSNTQASGLGSIAIGGNAISSSKSLGSNSISLGGQSSVVAAAISGIAIGRAATVNNAYGIAMGDGTTAGNSSIALGSNAQATGNSSISVGTGNKVSGNSSGAFSTSSTISGTNSYTFGNNNNVNANNVFALGNNITIGTGLDGAIALGNNSTVAASNPTATVTVNGTSYNLVGGTPATGDVLSVGSVGGERQIINVAAGRVTASSSDSVNGSQLFATNQSIATMGNRVASGTTGVVQRTSTTNSTVLTAADGTAASPGAAQKLTNLAAGTLSATSTDAVNGGQLFATNSNVTNLGTSTAGALGGGAAYNTTTGAWTAPNYSIQGSNYSSVGDAFGGVNTSLTSLSNRVASGTTGVVQRTSTANSTVLTAADGTAASPGAAQKLTNLAAGSLSATSTDAVNGGQLFATNSNVTNLGTSTAGALGGGAAYNTTTGAWTAPNYSIQGSNYSSVGDAFGGVNTSLTSLSNRVASGTTGVVQRTSTTNSTVLTAADGTAASPGAAQKLTNLAAGTLSATSTDAVNGGQLFATNSNVTNLGTSTAGALGGGAAYNTTTGAWTAPNYSIQGSNYSSVGDAFGGVNTSLTNLSNRVASGTTGVVQRTSTANSTVLTAADGTAASPGAAQKLTNLAAGSLSATSTDAVNGGQLFATNSNVTNLGTSTAGALGGGAAYNTTTGAWTAPNYSIQGSNYSSVGDAFGGVNTSLTNLSNRVASGTTGVVQRTSTANSTVLTAADGTAASPGAAQKLTNLAAGSLSATSTDAVNGGQLFAVADQVSKNTTNIADLTTIVNNSAENNLVKQNDGDNGITIGAGKAGPTVSLVGTEGDRTLTGVANGVAANDAVTVGQMQSVVGNISSRDDTGLGGATATGEDGLAVGAGAQATGTNSSATGSGAKAVAENATAVGQGATASGISSVAAGQGSNATGAQTIALGGASSASGSNSVALGYGSVADRNNSVSVGGVDNERQITNVAAGTSRTDAANVGQVNDAFQSLGNSMNKKINDLDKKLTGGIASAIAMSGIPQAYLPDSSLVGASASTYNGQSAISVGVSKISENGKFIMKISGSGNTQSDFGAAIGVGYQW